MTHPYWGQVEKDWAGFKGDKKISHPFFNNKEVEIFLGYEFDENSEEIDVPPNYSELDYLAEVFKNFETDIDRHLLNLQNASFDRFKKHYSSFYKNGHVPLDGTTQIIDTVDNHNIFIRDLIYLRVTIDKVVRVSIRYQLDSEHGLEFKFSDGQLNKIGGIAET